MKLVENIAKMLWPAIGFVGNVARPMLTIPLNTKLGCSANEYLTINTV